MYIMKTMRFFVTVLLHFIAIIDCRHVVDRQGGTKSDSNALSNDSHSDQDDILQDHIFGMKIERDGHENRDFHKEVFLGLEMEKFQNGDHKAKDPKKELKGIFKAVDTNNDLIIDEKEMTDWVLTKTREHFYEARMSNERLIEKLDVDANKEVSWNEFLSYLVTNDDVERKQILQQLDAGETIKIPEKLENRVQHLRESWIRVQEAGKKSLTYSQFFDFQHPETSSDTLKFLVEDILHDMDTDDSNDITVQEYVAMPPDADVDATSDVWTVERRTEFREVIDRNRDGKVTVEELEAFLDPLSRTMAAQEARQLIGFGDSNEDGNLSLEEILENSEFYTGSKLYNYARNVHEEF